jgi:hypothetical protein
MRTFGTLVVGLFAARVLLADTPAAASCRIKNETGYTFAVASGNVPNQKVGARATTTIAPGKVQGRSDDGKTISGVCKDGGDLIIKEKNGVPLLGAAPKKKTPAPTHGRSTPRAPVRAPT